MPESYHNPFIYLFMKDYFVFSGNRSAVMLGKETSVDDGQQVRRQSKEYLKEERTRFSLG
jgi:nuclear transport factor 2 (NTF2) superfamily protein